MNVVRSAGGTSGGGGGRSDNYQIENVLLQNYTMWHAVETSIQSFNKNRRLNMSFRKTTTKGSSATNPISRPICSITDLMKKTRFTKEEIRHFYRSFKQDSPTGQVSKEHFATIFGTLFPTGECYRYSIFLFRNIDRGNTGIVRFEDLLTTFSLLIHGSLDDRLGWIFDLYDLNKDGKLTRIELLQLVASVFQLIVPVCKLNYASINNLIEQRTDQLFHDWDIHGNGFVYREDFLFYCKQNPTIIHAMDKFKKDLFF